MIQTKAFTYDTIDEYQLEITSHCNASCPQCPRNMSGGDVIPNLPVQHLSKEVIANAFDEETCKRIRMIFFCGSHGDPIAHPHFLEILKDLRAKNEHTWLYIHTNGGIRSPSYWKEMAHILNGYGQVDFGIDGLEDTAHLYRKGVKYTRVMENAKAFIDANGRAQWNFIVFKHNEHQVDQVKKLGKELGFYNVLVRNTGRFFNHRDITEMTEWVVHDKGKTYKLYPPSNPDYRNNSMKNLVALREEYKNLDDYFNTTEIFCDALHGNKVAINADGLMLPCNFLSHNLYDQRFFDPMSMPGAYHLSTNKDGKNHVRAFLEQYGLDNLNIKHKSIPEIFQNRMWADLTDSLDKDFCNGRLFECAMTCGSKISKVWDQSK